MKIGFMQGRLSPMIDGKIQYFPWGYWENEFKIAGDSDFNIIEWTIDQDRLHENPLMTSEGQNKIKELSKKYNVQVTSVTGDCFMQDPFYKASGEHQESLISDFRKLCKAANNVGATFVVIPLVDAGRLENKEQESEIIRILIEQKGFFDSLNIKIVFESDYTPEEYLRFLNELPAETFGVNFDSGNSAALGFTPEEEFKLYGDRVLNVHIKDRVLNGTTVPLGSGDCDFKAVFEKLTSVGYNGNLILQTARAQDDSHLETLVGFRDFVKGYLG